MLEEGIRKIYSEDFEAQQHFINVICTSVRKMSPEILYQINAFFVPNEEYMIKMFGYSIKHDCYDCYDFYGNCKWTGHLVIPIRDIHGVIKGFSGYNPAVTVNNRDVNPDEVIKQMSKYKESNKKMFDKSRFTLCPLGLEKAIKDGYVIVTDGVFDALSLASFGLNSLANLGSNLSKEVLFCLDLIDVKYVAFDNDNAGIAFYRELKTKLTNVYSLTQNKCKDIDEFIRQYPNEFKQGITKINTKLRTNIVLSCTKFTPNERV